MSTFTSRCLLRGLAFAVGGDTASSILGVFGVLDCGADGDGVFRTRFGMVSVAIFLDCDHFHFFTPIYTGRLFSKPVRPPFLWMVGVEMVPSVYV